MDKKRSCFNCVFSNGKYCYGAHYGSGILVKDLKLCSDWELPINDFINLFEELKEQDIDLWNHYINGNGNAWEYVYKIYKGD